MILQLHSDLYKFSGQGIGGKFKTVDNIITEEREHGEKYVRFTPVPALETASAMDDLCKVYEETINDESIDKLLIIPMFVLDFLCIHPFNDGNGRMSRLLTLLLLYRSGYIVGKYISIEKIIEKSQTTYYEVLQDCSFNWHDNKNEYVSFVEYILGVILVAYRDFSSTVITISTSGLSKPERIRELIKDSLGKITKAQIANKCPDISDTTIKRTLNDLLKKELIIKHGGGRYTFYTWNRE